MTSWRNEHVTRYHIFVVETPKWYDKILLEVVLAKQECFLSKLNYTHVHYLEERKKVNYDYYVHMQQSLNFSKLSIGHMYQNV